MSLLFEMSQQLADDTEGSLLLPLQLWRVDGDGGNANYGYYLLWISSVQRGSGQRLRKKVKFHLNTWKAFDWGCAQTLQQAAWCGGRVTLQIFQTWRVAVLGSSDLPGQGGWPGLSPHVPSNPTAPVKASFIFECILLLLLWNTWRIITNAPAGHLSHKYCCCVITAVLIV